MYKLQEALTPTVDDLSIAEVDLFLHLVEILGHFFRQHHFRSKYFIISEQLPVRVVSLLKSPEKHLKLGKYVNIFVGSRADKI